MAKELKAGLGAVTGPSPIAILLIDVINDLDFAESSLILPFVKPMAQSIANLTARARESNIPVIFVNDNFGRWRSDFRAQMEHCLREDSLGREMVSLLRPQPSDYFVLKPKHSGFYGTTLEILLGLLKAETLVLCGIAANICVLFTANDAYMRDFRLIVPEDCVASNTLELTKNALAQMSTVLKADTRLSSEIVGCFEDIRHTRK